MSGSQQNEKSFVLLITASITQVFILLRYMRSNESLQISATINPAPQLALQP